MTYEEVNLGFSTADAEVVKLSYSLGDLLLEFRDWQENVVSVRFEEAIRFSWTDELSDDIRPDVCYRIDGSPWTATDRSIYGDTVFSHYKLCFNQCGTLDVACRQITVP